MRPLGAGILGHPLLQPRERELLILRTCARTGAEYEWGVHAVAFAKPLGLSDRQLAATVRGPADDRAWSPADAQLIAAADALYDSDTHPDTLWDALSARFASAQLLELVVVAGWYRLISYVVNARRSSSSRGQRASRDVRSVGTGRAQTWRNRVSRSRSTE